MNVKGGWSEMRLSVGGRRGKEKDTERVKRIEVSHTHTHIHTYTHTHTHEDNIMKPTKHYLKREGWE
jgi:hypothetical protein